MICSSNKALLLTSDPPKTDPWNLDDMGSSLPSDKQKQRKTPQEFLGANSGLVNLDDLVKTDTTSKKGIIKSQG